MTTTALYKYFKASNGISTDTRNIREGQLFFALQGENFDANEFAQQALETGASYAIIDNPQYHSENCLLVEDALTSLQELARYHRQKLKIPIIGLTGSNGKTTTKELLGAVLSEKYKTACTRGNLNNHIGVPLSLLSITEEHEMAIIEMGANHQGEIAFLSSICQPDYGYVTNFGKAHMEGFGGIEGIIKGKSELYHFLRKFHKTVLVNLDDPQQVALTEGLSKITFGQNPEAQFQIKMGDNKESVSVKFNRHQAQTQLTGAYNFSNIGAAVAMGRYFEVKSAAIKKGLEAYKPQNNRSQIQQTAKNKLVIDAYNANPTSTHAALLNFDQLPGKSKWVILGDMFELGQQSQIEHEAIVRFAMSCDLELVILVGNEYAQSCRDLQAERLVPLKDTESLLDYLKYNTPSGKTILIKGSRGMKLERSISFL